MTDDVRPTGTYKTLAEQREVLTPAEERFERARQTIGLILGPIAFLIMYFLPLPLDQNQQTLAAILAFTIIYWLSEAIPIPVTAVLALALCVVFNVPAVGPNAAGLDPLVPALAAVFGASFGFMMPVSTPQNAVVYGSGMIPITKMVRSGLVFDIIGLILIVLLIPVMAGLILA